jgi:hypothetical protein
MKMLASIDPEADFEQAPPRDEDYVLTVGTVGANRVYGAGWTSQLGDSEPVPVDSNDVNPFGGAFAAVAAAAHIFVSQFENPLPQRTFDVLRWLEGVGPSVPLPADQRLGHLWFIGAGSVGTAVMFFTTMWTSQFSCDVFDMDVVEVHNMDRSPVFTAQHGATQKAPVAAAFLRDMDVSGVTSYDVPLHVSWAYKDRRAGSPDLAISAANEFDVRYFIESAYPAPRSTEQRAATGKLRY